MQAGLNWFIFLPGVGMLLVAAGFGGYALDRRLPWRYVGLGALAWVITVALKFAWAIPVNTPIYNFLNGLLPSSIGLPVFYVYVGALTGIFEVGITYLFLRFTRFGKCDWAHALAFGLGFGAIEALVLGLSPLIAAVILLVAPSAMPSEFVAGFLGLDLATALAPTWERFFTVWIHIFSNALIFYAIGTRQLRYFWLAFAYKTGIDAVAAYAQLSGLQSLAGLDAPARLWAIELVVGIWGALGWFGVHRLESRYPAQPVAQPVLAPAPA